MSGFVFILQQNKVKIMTNIIQAQPITHGFSTSQVRTVKPAPATNFNIPLPVKNLTKDDGAQAGAQTKVASKSADPEATSSGHLSTVSHSSVISGKSTGGGYFSKQTPSEVLRTYNSFGGVNTPTKT